MMLKIIQTVLYLICALVWMALAIFEQNTWFKISNIVTSVLWSMCFMLYLVVLSGG